MMKKLTKEQARRLVEEFQSWFLYSGLRVTDNERIYKIISQCTENKFPFLEMNLYELHEVEKGEMTPHLELSQPGDYSTPIELEYTDTRGKRFSFLIPVRKFKTLAEGCQHIVSWLDENDAETN